MHALQKWAACLEGGEVIAGGRATGGVLGVQVGPDLVKVLDTVRVLDRGAERRRHLALQQLGPLERLEEGVPHDIVRAGRPVAQPLGRLALQQPPQHALCLAAHVRCAHDSTKNITPCTKLHSRRSTPLISKR